MVVEDSIPNSTMSNQIPAQLGAHIDVLKHWKDGSLLLGTSNLTSRYWNGSIWCFDDSDAAPDILKCVTGRELDCGICDAQVFGENKALLALDSGSVELLEIMNVSPLEKTNSFTSVAYCCDHDNSVHSIGLTSCGTQFVTGSWDRSIKVWDLESCSCAYTYRDAHSHLIWSVACHLSEPYIFISSAQDGTVRLWDTRLTRPAAEICKGVGNQVVTVVAWNPASGNSIVIGDETGKIFALDTRGEGSVLSLQIHKHRINRLEFAHHIPNCIATCADETPVCVTSIEGSGEKIYEDDVHNDFVCGLSWHPKNFKLYSAGFDSQVKSHVIEQKMNCNEIAD